MEGYQERSSRQEPGLRNRRGHKGDPADWLVPSGFLILLFKTFQHHLPRGGTLTVSWAFSYHLVIRKMSYAWGHKPVWPRQFLNCLWVLSSWELKSTMTHGNRLRENEREGREEGGREILLYAYPTLVISFPRPPLIPDGSHLLTLLRWDCIHSTLGFGHMLIPQPLKYQTHPAAA